MKAYKISCRDDDHGHIVVFAERIRDVHKRSNSEHCDCEWVDIRVERAPQFDKYSPGPVGIRDYLAEGWHWSCQRCDKQVYSDDAPIIAGDMVFCSRNCLVLLFDQYKAIGPNPHESIRHAVAAMWEVVGAP